MRYIHQQRGWPKFLLDSDKRMLPVVRARLGQGMLFGACALATWARTLETQCSEKIERRKAGPVRKPALLPTFYQDTEEDA
jgi:hypothetical protein